MTSVLLGGHHGELRLGRLGAVHPRTRCSVSSTSTEGGEGIGGGLDAVQTVDRYLVLGSHVDAPAPGSPELPRLIWAVAGMGTVVTDPAATVKLSENPMPGTSTVPLVAVGPLMNSDNSGVPEVVLREAHPELLAEGCPFPAAEAGPPPATTRPSPRAVGTCIPANQLHAHDSSSTAIATRSTCGSTRIAHRMDYFRRPIPDRWRGSAAGVAAAPPAAQVR